MTRNKAIKAMKRGQKVTHRFFNDHEWVTIENGMVVAEDGHKFLLEIFMGHRNSGAWLTDWSLFVSASEEV